MNFIKSILNCCTIDSESGISELLDNYLKVYSRIKDKAITSFRVIKYFRNPLTKSEKIILEVNGKVDVKILTKRAESFSIYENGKAVCSDKHIDW